MPRRFTQIPTGIWRDWRDGAFTRLTIAQQGVYFMLETQQDITAAGVLSLTERRWAKLSADMTAELIRTELEVLAQHGLVVVDEDTEELLLVPFVESDNGYSNGKRRPVIADAARAVASPLLRSALAVELTRLGLDDIASGLHPDSPSHRASDTPSARVRDSPSISVEDAASDAVSPSDRVGVTEVGQDPQPPTPKPEREPSASRWPISDLEPPPFCHDHPGGTTQPCGPCGSARRINHDWHAQRTQREAEARSQLAQQRRDCTRCDENGLIPISDHQVIRCDHQPETSNP
jgi:hypothetical protein